MGAAHSSRTAEQLAETAAAMGPFPLDRVVAQAALDGLVQLREEDAGMMLRLPLADEGVMGGILDALADVLRGGKRATLLLCPFGAAIQAAPTTQGANGQAASPGCAAGLRVGYELAVQFTTAHLQDAYLILAGVQPSEHAREVLPWARVPGFLEALQRMSSLNWSCAGQSGVESAGMLRVPLQPLAVPVIIQCVLEAGGTVEVVEA